MHGLVNFDSIFDCSFCSLDERDFGKVLLLFWSGFLKIVELSDGDSGFFDTFFPDFKLLVFEFLLFFSLFLLFFHSKDLNGGIVT